METPRQQEARARQRISPRGIIAAAATAGTWTFIFPGGAPWSGAGTMNAIMGRDMPIAFITLLLGHFAVALFYAMILAIAVYRFRLLPALLAGLVCGAALYGGNLLVFRILGGQMHSAEPRAFLAHLVFCLFATLIYKAAGVPRPLPTRPGESVAPSAPSGPRPADRTGH